MGILYFTRRGIDEFNKQFERTADNLKRATDEKGFSGNGPDAWHDEGHKIALVDEMMWSQRLGEMQVILSQASLIEPEEQKQKVRIGNGVRVEFEDGTEKGFIIDGYLVSISVPRISIYSPLGRALVGKEEGDSCELEISGKKRVVTIMEIIMPSEAERLVGGGSA